MDSAAGMLAVAGLDREDGPFRGPVVDVHHGFEQMALADSLRRLGLTDIAFDLDPA